MLWWLPNVVLRLVPLAMLTVFAAGLPGASAGEPPRHAV